MPYLILTQSHIEPRISDAERGALDDAGQEGGYESRLPGIIAQITSLVRAKVATCRANALAAEGIPEECLFHAVTLCRHALLASLPVADGYIDPRQAEYQAAVAFLDQVATGAISIATVDGQPSNATGMTWSSEALLSF